MLRPHGHGYHNSVILLLRTTKRGQPDSDKVILTAPGVIIYLGR